MQAIVSSKCCDKGQSPGQGDSIHCRDGRAESKSMKLYYSLEEHGDSLFVLPHEIAFSISR